MKKSKSKGEVEAGKDSKLKDRQVDEEPLRADLKEVIERHSRGLDERRPEAVARRRETNQRTVRENIKDLCDGHLIEYGALAVAGQRQRRTMEDLMSRTPADGVITGIGSVNGSLFGEDKARCMIIA